MSKDDQVVLINDSGHDLRIASKLMVATEVMFCSKTGKEVGSIKVFKATESLVISLRDRRKPIGKVNQIFQFPINSGADVIYAATGMEQSVKRAMRKSGVAELDMIETLG